MSDRIPSFSAFFPYYLGEHRDQRSRWLHFAGTTTFLAVLLRGLAADPLRMGLALAAALGVGALARGMEAKRNAAPALLLMVGLLVAGDPFVLVGIVLAYAHAWVGHFVLEKNRPATFQYPLWSLTGDFVMWSRMLRGQLWRGDSLPAGSAPGR
jgi:hypothetical protein